MAGTTRGGRKQRIERCVFCGKSASDVERLIAGPPGTYICNECIELCYSIITEDEARGTRRFEAWLGPGDCRLILSGSLVRAEPVDLVLGMGGGRVDVELRARPR